MNSSKSVLIKIEININYLILYITNKMAATQNEELSQKYQQKTDKEHILANPDTYIGSVEEVDSDQWILDETTQNIVLKNIKYVPGL